VSPIGFARIATEQPQWAAGQLITPLSNHRIGPWPFAIDNGCFKEFRQAAWERLLKIYAERKPDCLWVAAPDVVGSARRTAETFAYWGPWLLDRGWPAALVAQDGIEDLPIPWDMIRCIFIGGTDRFKDSEAAMQVAKAAKLLGKLVHVGRVNAKRILRWMDIADTGDGSGYASFKDEMFARLNRKHERHNDRPLMAAMEDETV
jgi:hypothetical protein